MRNPERSSLIRFVLLFVFLNTVFLLIISTIYYRYQKNIYFELRRDAMVHYAKLQLQHLNDSKTASELKQHLEIVGKDPRYAIAFLDQEGKILFSSVPGMKFPFKTGIFEYHGFYYYIDPRHPDYLKEIRYIVVRAHTIKEQLHETLTSISIFLIFSIFFLSIAAYLLSNLFLQPVKATIRTLNRFIRDTTHELNTPLSVITMSIEQLKSSSAAGSKQIQRLEVASRTLSNLYNDLTFMLMYDRLPGQTLPIDLKDLLEERVEYFRPIADAKGITVILDLQPVILDVSREKISRLIDNLISNAIKYNKPKGKITISLHEQIFQIEDTGIGISEEDIHEIFVRYKRFDDANGGFGIGLNLVQMICDEYNMDISVDSIPGQGSAFTIRW